MSDQIRSAIRNLIVRSDAPQCSHAGVHQWAGNRWRGFRIGALADSSRGNPENTTLQGSVLFHCWCRDQRKLWASVPHDEPSGPASHCSATCQRRPAVDDSWAGCAPHARGRICAVREGGFAHPARGERRFVFIKRCLVLLAICILVLAGCEKSAAPLPTVASVDLTRYAGKWYEVARLPNSFQRDDSTATAEYTLNPDGTVGVRNTETRPDGSTKVATGKAEAVPGSNQTRLRVSFSGLASLAPNPKEGNYWIIGLEPDYSVAVVGTPGRKYLWILAREPQPSQAKIERWTAKARELGFPVERLIYRKG